MSDQKVPTIEKLKIKREQLSARIKKIESREKYKMRKLDARRKMLIGAYFLEKAEAEGTMDEIIQLMDEYLKHRADRLLFGLQSIDETKTVAPQIG